MRSPRPAARLYATIAALGFVASLASSQTPIVPLKISNGAAVARTQEPVSVGVPIGKVTPFYATFGARVLTPGGVEIPAQFKVLSRWDGMRDDATKPIKWLLVSFKADVAANATATYQLALSANPNPQGTLWAAQDMQTIQVWTSANTWFKIDRLVCTLFKEAVVDGASVISTPGSCELVFADGTEPEPWVMSTDLEEYYGYLSTRCVVRQRGMIGPLGFTIRYTFYAGRSSVDVDFRLENPAAYGLFSTTIPDGQKYFRRLHLNLPVAGGAAQTVTTDAAQRTVAAGSQWTLAQDFAWTSNTLDALAGFSWQESTLGDVIASGNRYSGALDVSSPTAGVTVAVDRFWENFPKAYEVQNGSLAVCLWPEFGEGPLYQGQYAVPWISTPPVDASAATHYRFEGGRHKTHRMTFDFHPTGPRTALQVAEAADRARNPLAGCCPGAWYRQTWAMHSLWTERSVWGNAAYQRYEKFYDILVDDNAADDLSSIGKVGLPKFMARGGTNGGWQMYGWDNFGDISWADGYCGLHYDFAESMLSGYLRTGDYRFFRMGVDLAAYRRDYGQNHSANVAETWRGAQFYEKGWWHGSYVQGQSSHNWVAGLLMHYVITGDEFSREAAIENLAFTLRDPPKNWNGYWGSRIPGWQINCLVDGYNVLGNPVYLTEAGLGVNKYQILELSQGGNGYVLNLGTNPQTMKPWMENIFFIAAAKYVLTSGDPTYNGLLDRMRLFFRNVAIIPGTGPITAQIPTQVWYEWAPPSSGFVGTKSVHLLWPMAEAMAYSAAVFQDVTDQNWASLCFETVCRFWQASGTTAVDFTAPTTYSKITFKPSMYPGTESKAIANLLRWAPAHLTVQRFLDGQW